MSAEAAERPDDDLSGERSLLAGANLLMGRNPGHRVEIIGGQITVTAPPDVAHARALTDLMVPFLAAGLHGIESKVLQGVGLWLPTGAEDYAIPDLVVVDADIDEHLIENNCYDPLSFRLVLEVTSSNYQNDLRAKVTSYAAAEIPVYVIVDRKHGRLHTLMDPSNDEYKTHQAHAPGQLVNLPESIGAKVTLDVTEVLEAGKPVQSGS
ncbi:Uma2 family endonuclease [Streptomyces durmitorensis]|uniref:Uma2 family endonuclease n=1 Tax=Streptomyces durmitorensis TaxID=319947 RepID=A0ABY4PSA3_9ACTN|nr:Uma2 family endonuclease [Streptomyces durmitorensis]UQT56745.1 Uma2 family endonuclease [Streptomyces durmitorensis]